MNDLIKDHKAFEDDYLPGEIPQRETEVNYIDLALQRRSGNLALVGSTGSGKTASIRVALKEHKNLRHTYIPCSHNLGHKGIIQAIADDLGVHYNPKKESTSDLVAKIHGSLQESFYIILDDADRLKPSEICAVLKMKDTFPSLWFVVITNKLSFFRDLRRHCPDVLHRFASSDLHYAPYNVDELTDILLQRCKVGLVPGCYNEGDIRGLSALLSSKANGDARVGIQAIRVAADRASRERRDSITYGDLQCAMNKVLADNLDDYVMHLSKHEKILLLLLLVKKVSYPHLVKRYIQMVRETSYAPLDRSNIWRSFCRLGDAGLVYPPDGMSKHAVCCPAVEDKDRDLLVRRLKEDLDLLDDCSSEKNRLDYYGHQSDQKNDKEKKKEVKNNDGKK